MNRKIVWTEDRCAGCGRPAYERRDGRTYLYRYCDNGPAVCKPKCGYRYQVVGAGVDVDGWHKFYLRRNDGQEIKASRKKVSELRRRGVIDEACCA